MLDKRYDHKAVEEGKYQTWKDKGYFKAGDKSKPAFSLVIPPPNVTGKLHLGHVMDTIPDDIIVRYKKMKGFDVLWVPGCDHAGIATQAKVEEKLRAEGVSRYDLGREAFLEKAYAWKDEYAGIIHQQWAKLGLSVDYSRERFTLDEGLKKAVARVFKTLYDQGLIYRGERIINWDPELRTALSNIEVEHEEKEGSFYYFLYDVVGTDRQIVVATTRPETMFGDTAVFVNPKDERYKDLVGKKVINPANGEELPLMADSYVDISFGTGAMKCTPAHDPNDFALAKKYGFPLLKALDEEAKITDLGGKYAGMDRFECRDALVEDIKNSGHLLKIEKIMHSVPLSERSGSLVEPMVSKQWFVKMKPFAEAVLEMQRSGNGVSFFPERFEKVLTQWMENVEDWCVSRQLWWGHRIPAYYSKETEEVLVSETDPGEGYVQDEDVLDTWFSSALWPFATLGWPEKTPDFDRYYPTSVLVTGYDIIFFWVSRMVFQGIHFTEKVPFRECVIHGLIRDEQGRKMSKSLGNGIDPIEVIENYGADALRYFISTNSTPGQDMRYSEEKVRSSANYLNKIWNAARYTEITLGEDYVPGEIDSENLSLVDKAILYRLDQTIAEVDRLLDRYEFGAASTKLYDFVYDDFCSSYLEATKVLLPIGHASKEVLYKVVKSVVLLIYPFAPFIAEEIYLSLPGHKDSIMLEEFPGKSGLGTEEDGRLYGIYEKMLKDLRNYKVSSGFAPGEAATLSVYPDFPFDDAELLLSRFLFAKAEKKEGEAPANALRYPGYAVSLEKDIDPAKAKEEALKQKEKLLSEINRSSRLLDNPGFRAKAPQKLIEEEERKLSDNKAMLEEVEKRLAELGQ